MPDPMSLNTRDGSAWQTFFARFFALLKLLDAAQSGSSQHGEASPPEFE